MTDPTGAPLPSSVITRLLLVCCGMIQITLAAGLIVGWAGIAGSMLVESPENGGAGLTLDQTTQMFGLAASVNYGSPLFLGPILDKKGPRACSVVSNALVALGCFVFASASDFKMFSLGLCLVAFGGPGVQTSLIHLGNLFPERRFFVMGMVAESITLSFAVLPLMDVIWETTPPSVGFRSTFGVLAIMVVASTTFSLLVWPDAPYSADAKEGKEESSSDVTESSEPLDESLLSKEEEQGAVTDLQYLSFKEQLTSGVYIRLSIFFLVTSWWANFYIATVTVELGDQQLFTLPKQHELAELLSFIDAAAIVCAPLSGYLLDSVGFIPTALITITLGILQMVFLLVAGRNEGIMIASFVAYAIFRAFLFPYFFASLSRKLGFRFFGALSGISFFSSGVSQLLIAPLASLVEGNCHEYDDINETSCSRGRWAETHIVQILVMVALLLVPLMDHKAEKQQTKKRKLLDSSSAISYGSTEEGTELP